MKIRNNWKRAFKEGRLNDIPAEVRLKVIEQLEAGPKEEAFQQITKQDFIDAMDEHLEAD